MPPAKLKPSDIAAEAKRTYIPYIEQRFPQYPVKSYLYPDSSKLRLTPTNGQSRRLRVAVIDGDPIDVALDWNEYNQQGSSQLTGNAPTESGPIPVVSMANEKRAGGDWESGLIAPEECLCRRSNLVHTLSMPACQVSHYPIPTTGGIYSPHVGTCPLTSNVACRVLTLNAVVFRSGPEKGYNVWSDFKSLPIISVAPIRRPKLDEAGTEYSFDQERELMKEKMRTVLRIAAAAQHPDVCMGAFGAGPGFRNPVAQIAAMWKDILFSEPEFEGAFANIVFAIQSSGGSSPTGGPAELEVFEKEFHPSNIVKTTFRKVN